MLSRYIILHEKFSCGIYFCQTPSIFDPTWGKYRKKNGNQESITIPLIILPRSSNLHKAIISHEKFDAALI